MLRILFITATLLSLLPASATAADSQRVQAARIFYANGNPDQSIISAQELLKKSNIKREERRSLLTLIADAELMRATYKHFLDIEPATRAIEALLHEFPDHKRAAHYRWQRAWLWWKSGNEKQAMTATREVIARDQQPANLRNAWLLMTRIHLQQQHYAYARSDLLQYGLQTETNSKEQAVGMAWMAIVDQGEERSDAALANMNTVHQRWPGVLRDEPSLYAAYIELLNNHHQPEQALKLANDFLRRHISSDEAAGVRLIRAGVWSAQPANISKAIKEYGILSASRAETTIGKKAFIRKLMLENRDNNKRESLTPVMIALKKIADHNQLSQLEDEAMLDLARLWTRIIPSGPIKPGHTPALDAFARAATSTNSMIATTAHREGSRWLEQKIDTMLKQQQWLASVTAWRQFPQLQPVKGQAQPLKLAIAHAMRMLMLFDPAEEILQQLYKHNRTTLRGQMVMVEWAKLWLDQQQPDGVKKIMGWLNRNPFSIYRPEMLLIAGRIQVSQHQTELARQTLAGISETDVAMESRNSFWRTQAEIFEASGQWHSAARSWSHYRTAVDADTDLGLKKQADALFHAAEYSDALNHYRQIAADKQDTAWQYHSAVCQLRSGELKQGSALLQSIIASKTSGRFAALAKLALADQQAAALLGEKP